MSTKEYRWRETSTSKDNLLIGMLAFALIMINIHWCLWSCTPVNALTKALLFWLHNKQEQRHKIPLAWTERHNRVAACLLVRVMISGSPAAPECLTCGLDEDRCQYNSAYLSYDASYYRRDCYGQLPISLLSNESTTLRVSGLCVVGRYVRLDAQWIICVFSIFVSTRSWFTPLHAGGQPGPTCRSVYYEVSCYNTECWIINYSAIIEHFIHSICTLTHSVP